MKILVLGGSWYVGRHLVEAAVADGHDVTVFNRGRTPATYPPGVRVLRGDRTNPDDLASLAAAGPWDAAVDVPEMRIGVVRDTATALAPAVDRYVFTSSVSAYDGWPTEPGPFTEDSPRLTWDPHRYTPGGNLTYGENKVAGENAVRAVYGDDRTLIVRPGVVIGPGEYVGRIPWWLDRVARGGTVLAPGRPDRAIQPVDVRDLADFTLHLLTTGAAGAWNVAAPIGSATYGDLITAAAAAVGTGLDMAWVDEQWLLEQGVRQWTELPLWRTFPGTWALDPAKATAAGLTTRPLAQTVADVHDWLTAGGRPVDHERWAEHGIHPTREADLLVRWSRHTA